jgi:two-component system chemotaxis response regulator CheB
MTKKIRVLVVDDSSFLRRTLPRLLQSDPEIEVIGTAANGAEGVELAKTLHPDVITLDVMMPVMDGLTALKEIMREAPTAVLMVSSATTEGAHVTLDALAAGAVDFFAKPSGSTSLDIDTRQAELIEKVKIAHHSRVHVLKPADVDATRDKFRALKEELQQGSAGPGPAPAHLEGRPKRLVAIASSTGGPAALQQLFARLPAGLNAGMVLVQHIAAGFTKPLAERLTSISRVRVQEAEDGMPITPGVALLSPGNLHLTVVRERGALVARLSAEPAGTLHRPSADVLFNSIAACCADETCAVVLTGMGADGALGLRAIREGGGYTIAQDEATSLIYGMPRQAFEQGGAMLQLPLEQIAGEIARAAELLRG